MRHKLLKVLYMVAVLCLFPFLSAKASTLKDVFMTVILSNPHISASARNVDIAQENITQAQADFYPTVTATGSSNDTYTSNPVFFGGDSHPKVLSINLKQTLFAGGRILSGYRSSRYRYVAEKAKHDSLIQNTLNNLVTAYITVLTAKDILGLQKQQVDILQEQMKMTESRFSQGEVTQTDVMQATARLAMTNAEYIQAKGSYRTAQASLANLVGQPVHHLTWPKINFTLPPQYNKEVKQDVLKTHPDIMAALSELTSTRNNVKVAQAAHYPEIEAVANYNRNSGTSFGSYNDRTFGLQFSLPLFQGGRILSAVRSSILSKKQAEDNYEQVKRDIKSNLIDAFEFYNTSLASLKAFQKGELAAKHAKEGVEKEQFLGERTVIELLDARQELLVAQVNVAKGKGDVIIQGYNLLYAMGKLKVQSAH